MKLAVHIVLVLHICEYYDTVRIFSLLKDNWKKRFEYRCKYKVEKYTQRDS